MWWDEDSALAGLEIGLAGRGWGGCHLPRDSPRPTVRPAWDLLHTIGSPAGRRTTQPPLLHAVAVDVVGAVHRYNIDGDPVFILTKTEPGIGRTSRC